MHAGLQMTCRMDRNMPNHTTHHHITPHNTATHCEAREDRTRQGRIRKDRVGRQHTFLRWCRIFKRTLPANALRFMPSCPFLLFGDGVSHFFLPKLMTWHGWRPMDRTLSSNSAYVIRGVLPVKRATLINFLGLGVRFDLELAVRIGL